MYNPYLVVPFLVWIITQFIKFIVAAARGQVDFRYLYASGGMPSVHSAVVTSLATTSFLIDGPKSSIFGITAILAAIVMYDSFGVRRASGEQATAINLILDSLQQDRVHLAHPQKRLRELLGHKPLEVTVGALIGFVLGGLFNVDRLHTLFEFLSHPLARVWVSALGAISVAALIVSLVARFVYLRRYRKIRDIEEAIRRTFWVVFLLALIGALLAFLAFERIAAASWLVWPLLLIIAACVGAGTLIKKYRPKIAEAVDANRSQLEKERWFEGPNKKRRAAKERSRKRK